MRRLLWWFLSATLLGALISLASGHLVTRVFGPESLPQASVEHDKQYVEQFADRIKWLETIAYAVLTGIIGLRWSSEKLVSHATVAVASGCLAVSLFNGYRAHDEVLQALQLRAPMILADHVSRAIVICQFWFLVIAIALLAVRILSVPLDMRHRNARTLGILLIMSVSLGAFGQTASKPTLSEAEACSRKWVAAHYQNSPTKEQIRILTTIIDGTASEKKIDLHTQSTCAFSDSLLDYVANGSYELNGDREYEKFIEFARDTADAISNHGFEPSPFVTALWSMAEIFHQPRGLVRVASPSIGDEVLIDGKQVGLTPFVCAFTPKKYQLQVKHNGKVIHSEEIEVQDGQELSRKID